MTALDITPGVRYVLVISNGELRMGGTKLEFHILYPEKRVVNSCTIRTWFNDAKANGEIDVRFRSVRDTLAMARALSDAGIITLQRAGAFADAR